MGRIFLLILTTNHANKIEILKIVKILTTKLSKRVFEILPIVIYQQNLILLIAHRILVSKTVGFLIILMMIKKGKSKNLILKIPAMKQGPRDHGSTNYGIL